MDAAIQRNERVLPGILLTDRQRFPVRVGPPPTQKYRPAVRAASVRTKVQKDAEVAEAGLSVGGEEKFVPEVRHTIDPRIELGRRSPRKALATKSHLRATQEIHCHGNQAHVSAVRIIRGNSQLPESGQDGCPVRLESHIGSERRSHLIGIHPKIKRPDSPQRTQFPVLTILRQRLLEPHIPSQPFTGSLNDCIPREAAAPVDASLGRLGNAHGRPPTRLADEINTPGAVVPSGRLRAASRSGHAQRKLFNRLLASSTTAFRRGNSSTSSPPSLRYRSPTRQPDQPRRLARNGEGNRSFAHETRSADVRRRRPASRLGRE
ncbi:hypothetical protein OV450_7158 [Actinobacteria bacterium OV450]|nr:hypothetical protein OV450_7158 [Actinobacteria bacterium OV450]